jgi:uncharacterized oligopeptide transporter (OPT) family protein
VTRQYPSELTARAIVVGIALGALLAVVNTYVGLRTGLMESGNFVAVLLGFAICGAIARRAASALELQAVQAIATAAAGMVNVVGISGAMSGLVLLGHAPPLALIAGLGAATAALGLAMAAAMRAPLLVQTPLPFPTGRATGELIAAIAARGAGHRTRALFAAALPGALLAWLRDGRPSVVPPLVPLPAPYPSAEATGFGVATGSMLVGVGILVGPAIAWSIGAGSGLAWLAVGPWLVDTGRARPTYHDLAAWLAWPGVALVLAGSLTALVRARLRVSARVRPSAARPPRSASGSHSTRHRRRCWSHSRSHRCSRGSARASPARPTWRSVDRSRRSVRSGSRRSRRRRPGCWYRRPSSAAWSCTPRRACGC